MNALIKVGFVQEYIEINVNKWNSSDKYLYMPPFQSHFLPSFRR